MADPVVIEQVAYNDPRYQQVLALREDVLRRPLRLSLKDEDLSGEQHQTTIAAFSAGEVIGCLMLHPVGAGMVKLRQMAVSPAWQGKGIGRQLITYAEDLTVSGSILLHARQTAITFYERLGYHQVGDLFTEVGIPHIKMQKTL